MYSLIVSIYKVEAYLSRCIDSILAQTHTDFELILVDDGSPDRCPEICDEYAEKDQRVKVVHKANGGLISSRKAGLAVAKGEYICFVDGDDFIESDMLATYHSAITNHHTDIVCASFSSYYHDQQIRPLKQKISEGFYDIRALEKDVYPQMLSTNPFYTFFVFPSLCTKCIKKELLTKVYDTLPENITLGEDVAVTYPLLLNANSICVVDYYGYMYRQNLESMTHKYDEKLYGKVKSLVLHLNNIKNEYCWQAGNQIEEYIFYLLILAKNNEIKYNINEKYCVKKRNMKQYLNDPLFHNGLRNVKVGSFQNKFLLTCFRHKWILPIHLYEWVLSKR